MRVFIIVLHYGDIRQTIRCIESIQKFERNYIQIVVVDNTKSQNLAREFRSTKKMHIIRNSKNLGFAGGVNVGIQYALAKKATHVLLINNDAYLQQEIIQTMVKFFQKNTQSGIVAPSIEFYMNNTRTFDLGGKVNRIIGRTSHRNVQKITQHNPLRVDYVSGCCMCIKSEVFSKVGLFDERFFLYYEDVDFCLRARSKGYYSYVLPDISIFHELSSAVGRNSHVAVYHQLRSGMLFGNKHMKGIYILFNRFFMLFQSLIMLKKNVKNAPSVVRALLGNSF